MGIVGSCKRGKVDLMDCRIVWRDLALHRERQA